MTRLSDLEFSVGCGCRGGYRVTSTRETFVAVVDLGTRISFIFARCRYLSIFRILLLTN